MKTQEQNQVSIDLRNKEFWNEMCGSYLAKEIGIKDHSKESLQAFDEAYINMYPYLSSYLSLDNNIKSESVLEVGLGYGTVSQLLAKSSVQYTGLDIAAGPVEIVNHRINMEKLNGKAYQGSMLNCNFPNESFDRVYSIGCFHHTGNMQKCVDETYRVLKPGGKAIIMVYNSFSYYRWIRFPFSTTKRLLKNIFCKNIAGADSLSNESESKAFDVSISSGKGAPQTEFFSKKFIYKIFSNYKKVSVNRENIATFAPKGFMIVDRKKYLSGIIAKYLGLDLYIIAEK